MSAERLMLGALPMQPWRNGAGTTREIACHPPGAVAFDWRLSVAAVETDAPFSAFPGIDRCIVLLSGAGMTLRAADGTFDHALERIGEPFRFEGDIALEAQLLDGPTTDLNVMTRRGAWRADVRAERAALEVPGADAGLLLAVRGEWIGADLRIAAGEALLWREGMPALRSMPAAASRTPLALVVRLLREAAA